MTTTRTSTFSRRSFRAASLSLLTGAGIALTPLAGSVAVAPPAAAAPVWSPQLRPGTDAGHARRCQQRARPAGQALRYGGTGPGGYDCSGLTYSAYQAAGVQLPRTSRAQATAGVESPGTRCSRVT